MVNIEISDYVKRKLEAIKESEQHKSFDSVIRGLLAYKEIKREK